VTAAAGAVAHRQVERVSGRLAGEMPAAGDGDEVAGRPRNSPRLSSMTKVQIALRADAAGEDLARARFFRGEDQGPRPIHSRQRSSSARRGQVRVEGLGSCASSHRQSP
jgi:hypothetical protein